VIKSAGLTCLALLLLAVGVRAEDAPVLAEALKSFRHLEPKSDLVSTVAASVSPMAARRSRFTSLTDAVAEAKRLSETEAGKLYDFDFTRTVSNRLGDILGRCSEDSKPPIIFDLVFVFAGDGHVTQVLQPPDSTVAACVVAKLGNLRLRAPPQPDWPVQLHIELRPPAEGGERDAAGKQHPLEPAVITEDRQLAKKAIRAEMNKNYEEALALYEKAIEVKGNFAPFLYQNRGMLYLHRVTASQDRQSKIADLERAIADFNTSIKLGAAAKDQLNRGLEKIATRANLDEATKLLEKETHR